MGFFEIRNMIFVITRLMIAVFLSVTIVSCSKKADVDTLLKSAQEAQAKGEYKSAIIHLKNAAQQAPENPEPRFQLGLVYNETDDPKSAEKEFRRALELKKDAAAVKPYLVKALLLQSEFDKVLAETKNNPQKNEQLSAELLSARGIAHLSLGAIEDAKSAFEKALAQSPDFPDALLGQARLAVATGDLKSAANLVDRALEKSPKHLDALLVKGDLQRLQNNNDAALEAYKKVTEYYPENIRSRLNIASVYLGAAKYEDALKQIDEVRKIEPQNPMTDYLQGLAEFRRQEYDKAKVSISRVLTITPDHIPTRLLAGAIEYAKGNYTQTEPHLKYVLDRAPNNLYARKLLAASYLRIRQIPKAISTLAPALNESPNDAALLAMAGDAYMEGGEFAKATAYYEKAARIDPKNAQMRTGLGLSRLAAGEGEGAIADLQAAVGLDADKYQADVLQVMAAFARNDYDKAEQFLQNLEKKQPNNPLTYNLKATILAAKKQYVEARSALEKALSLQPDYFPAIVNLAQLDIREKNPSTARKRLEALLQKNPNHTQALLTLANFGNRIDAKPEEIIDWLIRAKRTSPGALQPSLMLAQHYLQVGDFKKAVESAKDAHAISPDSQEVIEILGDAQMAVGERNGAVTSFSKLVALQPKSAVALVKLANAQIANENAPGAAFSLKKALELKPGFVEAQIALAGIEARAGRINEAMRIVGQLKNQAPKSSVAIVLEGDIRSIEKKYAEAVVAYEKALTIAPTGMLVIKLSNVLTQIGKVEEANGKLISWINKHPEDISVRFYVGDLGLKNKKSQMAIEQYEWIAKHYPKNILALNNLAWAYHMAGDNKALETAERVYAASSSDPLIMDTYGWMLLNYGRLEKGFDILQRAAGLAPEQQEIRYHYAAALVKTGKEELAKIELQRIILADPKSSIAVEAQALLNQLN